MSIEGTAVLITGADRGIGRALVEESLVEEAPARGARHVYAGTRAPLSAATALAAATSLGLAMAGWVVSVLQLRGMNMGTQTELGSWGSFTLGWVAMMAAMMLPGAVPAVVRATQTSGRLRAIATFVACYLAVWSLVGLAVYAFYRPHGYAVAGAVVIAAGIYELSPLKGRFRRSGYGSIALGWEFGLCCLGSSIGLMLALLAISPMSIGWMAVIAVLVTLQKLLPSKAAFDVPLALVIVGLGLLIIVAPSAVPAVTPSM